MKILNTNSNLPFKIGDKIIYNPKLKHWVKHSGIVKWKDLIDRIDKFNKNPRIVDDIQRGGDCYYVCLRINTKLVIGHTMYQLDLNGRSLETIWRAFPNPLFVRLEK